MFKVARRVWGGVKNNLYRSLTPYRIKPRLMVLEVTDACNSKCRHCNIWRKKPTQNMLTSQELYDVLSDPLFSQLEAVLLTGGEPSLRKDMKDLISAIHAARPKASIWYSTNALLVDKVLDDVTFALHEGVQVGVGVSLDGVGGKHDKVRGVKGNFEKADRLLQELLKIHDHRLNVSIGFTLSKYTYAHYWELKDYADELGVNIIVQMCDEASFYGNIGNPYVDVTEGEYREKTQEIVKSLPNSLLKTHWLHRLNETPKHFKCYALCSFYFQHCNGDVSPCLRRYHTVYGNVRTSTPSNIWRSSKMKLGREVVRQCNPQCLNDWGFNVSIASSYLKLLWFKLTEKLRVFSSS